MPESSVHPLESILRLCAAAAPEPWYPSVYAKETNTPRDTLDPYLDQLRMAGLVHLTDWVPGHGQGYALTPAGEDVLKDPRQLARLLAGKWSLRVVRDDRPQARAAPSPWERGEAVREALMYPFRPTVTYALIAINIGAFVLQCQSRQFRNLLVADAPELLNGQWWRLLTTAFLHAGSLGMPWHLAMNMFALYSLGPVTERIWGHGRFLAIYLVAAIGSTCLALITDPIGCIGASGAICGVFGAWAAWLFYNRHHIPRSLFLAWQRTFMINVVLLVIISFVPGVSWAGHLGGAIAGLALALWFSYFQTQFARVSWLQWAGMILIPAVSVGFLVRTMNTNPEWVSLRKKVELAGQHVQSDSEIEEFNESFLPEVKSSIRGVMQMETNVGELLEVRPSRRKNVAQAIAEIDVGAESLEHTAHMLRQRGPFVTPLVEQARTNGLNLVEAHLELLGLFKECLGKGEEWTEKDEERLQKQKLNVEKAETGWRSLFR
jgi:membrane associated rhomboid family serine protease